MLLQAGEFREAGFFPCRLGCIASCSEAMSHCFQSTDMENYSILAIFPIYIDCTIF